MGIPQPTLRETESTGIERLSFYRTFLLTFPDLAGRGPPTLFVKRAVILAGTTEQTVNWASERNEQRESQTSEAGSLSHTPFLSLSLEITYA